MCVCPLLGRTLRRGGDHDVELSRRAVCGGSRPGVVHPDGHARCGDGYGPLQQRDVLGKHRDTTESSSVHRPDQQVRRQRVPYKHLHCLVPLRGLRHLHHPLPLDDKLYERLQHDRVQGPVRIRGFHHYRPGGCRLCRRHHSCHSDRHAFHHPVHQHA